MGKIAVISDIHSNIYALEAVLKDIQKRRNVEEIICLGDVVGYYPYPNESIELIKENCSICMLGNHDAGVLGDEPSFYFNPTAYEMIVWTKKQLKEENFKWLTTLPRKISIERNGKTIFLVHGSPFRIFDYFDAYSDKQWKAMLQQAFVTTNTDVLLVGHTHVPVKIIENSRIFVNPGSVGQPRHGISGAFYSIMNLSSSSIEMVSLRYDFSPLQEKMEELELPKSLSDRLNHGL